MAMCPICEGKGVTTEYESSVDEYIKEKCWCCKGERKMSLISKWVWESEYTLVNHNVFKQLSIWLYNLWLDFRYGK